MITQELKTYVSRFVRKLILRGRAAVGYYSMEGYQSAPDEPTQNIVAKRVQHYGFVSEPPDGAEVIAVAIGGGASNRAVIAETVIGEPEIEDKEVLLWSEFGQRVLLDKNYRVDIDNGNGGTVEVAGFTTTISDDAVVARDLTVNRDTRVDHLLGGSDVVLTCVANVAGGFATATALGNDLAFDVTFTVAPSVTVNPGTKLATVTFARAFDVGLAPRFVASAKSGSFGAAAAFGATVNGVDKCDVYWHGAALNGPLANLVCTVAVFGKR
jgi:phage gp45-like